MGSNKGINFFLELNDHSIGVAKTSSTSATPSIEGFREACLDDAASVKEAINAITGGNSGEPTAVHCALRPGKRFFDLASLDDARSHKTTAAIEDYVAKSVSIKSEDTNTAAIYARTGQPVDGSSKDSWFAATTTKESAKNALEKLKEWNLKSDGFESASVSLIGSVQAALKAGNQSAPVVCWDIGESSSDLFLIGQQGIEGSRRIGFGYDQVAEAIQAEIQLKFKAAAAKLFFNDRYDFATNAPKIAKRVATLLESEITKLSAESTTAPTEFFCAGLPTKQGWFTRELAASLQFKAWTPDLAGWSKQSGIILPESLSGSSCSPSWLGLFGMAAAHSTNKLLWHPKWDRANAPIAASAATAPAQAEPAKKAAATPAPAKAQPQAAVAKPAPAAQAKVAKPEPKKQEPVKKESAPVAAVKQEKAPKAPKAPGSGNSTMIKRVAMAAAGAILLGGGFFYLKAVKADQQAALEAKKIAEQRAAADAEARQEAEMKALAEAEARMAAEREAAEKEAVAKAAREKAEEEARLREIENERLMHARGSVEITTVPAGATVTVGNLASKTTPASYGDLRLGGYTAEISMEGYETATVKIEVKENQTTSVGPVRLVRHVGTLIIETKPAGLNYEVRPASSGLFASSSQKRIGITPHTVTDLPTDDYIVTIQRDGWPSVTQNVHIEKGKSVTVNRDLSGGTVVINSDPVGAEVFANGESLGKTPLTLNNIQPGGVSYTLNRNLYHSATLTGTVAPEKTLNLSLEMEPIEYIAKAAELDRWPAPTRRIEPTLPNPERFAGKSVTLTVTISDDGDPMDIIVSEATDEELALYCVDAVSQWEFSPGKVGRRNVWSKVTIPFSF